MCIMYTPQWAQQTVLSRSFHPRRLNGPHLTSLLPPLNLGAMHRCIQSLLCLSSTLQPLLCLYAAPALWNRLPKDLLLNPPLNFTYPPLALSSATFHSRLKTKL